MENKNLYIGLGIIAIIGITYCISSKKQKDSTTEIDLDEKNPIEKKSGADGDCGCGCNGESKSNIQASLNSCYDNCMKDTNNNMALCKSQCGSGRKVKMYNNTKSNFNGNTPIYQGREVFSTATPYIPSNRKPFFYAY